MPLEIETEVEFDLEDLKEDIEVSKQTDRWSDAPPNIKELFHQIEWNVIEGEHADTVGASTLQVGHVKLLGKNTIKFDERLKTSITFSKPNFFFIK